jgi:sugar phosphate isomerase/epimerase
LPLTADLKHALQAAGVSAHHLTVFYLTAEPDWQGWTMALHAGAELGAGIALVIGDDEDWSRMTDTFGRLCETADAFGIRCAIENAPYRALGTVERALRLIRDSGAARAGLCLNPLNHAAVGGSVADIARLDPARLLYAQFADGRVDPALVPIRQRLARLMPGQGTLDLAAIIAAAPPDLALAPELAADDDWPIDAWAAHVCQAVRAWLDAHAAGGS